MPPRAPTSAVKKPAVKKPAVKQAAVKKAAAAVVKTVAAVAKKPAAKVAKAKEPAAKAAAPQGAAPQEGADVLLGLPVLGFEDAAGWEAWLARHHATSKGLWLKMAKKATGVRSVDYPQALDAALCWGWIDGQRRGLDAGAFLQRFTPRGKRSIWSKVNREKVAALIASGRMQPPGLAEVQRAQADGRWEAAYDSPSRATVPPDLEAALAANPRARAFFATVSATNRYAVLHRVHTAKKPETRARRITLFVDMLARGEVVHPDR
jgi:uncharacterized protein YdeI (YjbR/CyaY-like superfamily)